MNLLQVEKCTLISLMVSDVLPFCLRKQLYQLFWSLDSGSLSVSVSKEMELKVGLSAEVDPFGVGCGLH